jgi:cell wall-associated NlpC family hydrolase
VSLRAALAAGLVTCGVLAGGLPAAHAGGLEDAKRQAAALRAKVEALQTQAEIATEDYDAAYAQLGAAVSRHLTAQQALGVAEQAVGASDEVTGRRVRALYMSGGAAALYAHVLDSATITDVANRISQVKAVLAGDQRANVAAARTVAGRQAAEAALAASAAASTKLQKVVADRADAVRSLLQQTDALLAGADQRVRDIADTQRRAAEAAAAARAAVQLSAAQALTGTLPAVNASPIATAVLAFAQQQLGKPYVWGATGPGAFDCSGLTGAAYAAAGLRLPRTSREQWFAGPHVDLAALEPGDLMFWASDTSNPGSIHHVALYAGNGLMVAAPHSGDVVKVQPIYLDGYIGAVRPGASLTGG